MQNLRQNQYLRRSLFSALVKLVIVPAIALLLFSSCLNEPNYFKFTFTDELNPKGLLPEYYEINSNGKLVVLTNRFNESDERYNQTFFIELSKQQLDTALNLIQSVKRISNLHTDSLDKYLCRYDKISDKRRSSETTLIQYNSVQMSNLKEYCNKLLTTNKRYNLNHSYYFNTDEFCSGN